MKRFLLLVSMIILLAACSLLPHRPYAPGTMVEIEKACQENHDFPKIRCSVDLYAEPGKSKIVGSAVHGSQVEILDSMDYDGVLYYKIRGGQVRGWVTADHIK